MSNGAFECTRIYELFDLMNSYTSSNSGCCFYFEFTTREYESYEHANAISESELVNTTTLERTISVRPGREGGGGRGRGGGAGGRGGEGGKGG